MFSLFVRRDGLIDPPSLGTFDAHCHILPGLDDGPKCTEDSLSMARLLIEMGVQTVVATPHVISDIYPNSTADICRGVEKFEQLLCRNQINLTIQAGAEYYAEPAFLQRIKNGDLLCFGDKRYVLFECPVENAPMVLEEIIFLLKSNGYTPLLAHAERYRFLQRDMALVCHLRALGVHFQVNHPSFLLPKTSQKGETARKFYIKGYVDMLGTDMHRAVSWLRASDQTAKKKNLRNLF